MLSSYGLGVVGWDPGLFHANNMIGHGGNPIGYAAGCFYLQDEDVIISVMDNTEEGEAMLVINEIIDLVKEEIGK